jgi:hypothetical protein
VVEMSSPGFDLEFTGKCHLPLEDKLDHSSWGLRPQSLRLGRVCSHDPWFFAVSSSTVNSAVGMVVLAK